MHARTFIAILLSFAMTVMLAGCGRETVVTSGDVGAPSDHKVNAEDAGTSSDQTGADAKTPKFAELNDPKLLQYTEDSVYSDLEAELGEDYKIENVTAVYVPRVSSEYEQELAYNSRNNIYFGYTLPELDRQFHGVRYVFTMEKSGNTVATRFKAYDDTYDQAMTNVEIGTGVILVCVTVAAISGGVGAEPICAVFTAAAQTGTEFALSSGVLSAACAGAAKAYETGGDMEAVAKEAALKGSEGFKWGAIIGALNGAVGKANALRNSSSATKSIKGDVTIAEKIPTPRESELYALKKYGGKEQVSYLNGKEVQYGTKGATRPDISRKIRGKFEAIEVKNYDLVNNANGLYSELEREVSARVKNLPEGSLQRVVLDIRGRGYSEAQVEAVKQGIWARLENIYPNIPIDVMG